MRRRKIASPGSRRRVRHRPMRPAARSSERRRKGLRHGTSTIVDTSIAQKFVTRAANFTGPWPDILPGRSGFWQPSYSQTDVKAKFYQTISGRRPGKVRIRWCEEFFRRNRVMELQVLRAAAALIESYMYSSFDKT